VSTSFVTSSNLRMTSPSISFGISRPSTDIVNSVAANLISERIVFSTELLSSGAKRGRSDNASPATASAAQVSTFMAVTS
jgi:hypothetical protein